MDLISIILPVYNVELYLERCINSLLNQTYRNLEILLIDDGSTDNSGFICDNYAQQYNNIYSYHKENGGISSARNLGIEKINKNSKYIAFVDPDDFIDIHMYEILYKNIIESDADIAMCSFVETYDDNVDLKNKKHINNVSVMDVNTFIDTYFENNYEKNFAWNKLYKKYIFQNIRFEVGKKYEDQIIMPEIMKEIKSIAITNAKLYYYYQREGSILHGGSSGSYDDLLYAAKKFIEFGKQIKNKIFTNQAAGRYLGMQIARIELIDDKKSEKYFTYINEYNTTLQENLTR